MVSLLRHIYRVLKRQLLQMPFMVLVLKTLTKCRSTTFITPYTAAVTGEDVADIIVKLRSVYQKGHADKVVAPVADTKDEAPAAAAGAEHA